MAVGDHILKRPYNLRPRPTGKKVQETTNGPRKEQRMPSSVPYLSPEIIFNILIHLPADMLYNVMRYVCREWYNIIASPAFIDAHLLKANWGMLVKQCYPDYIVHHLQTVSCDIPEITDVDSFAPLYFGWSSCNGLVVMVKGLMGDRFIANLVTKEVVMIPPPLAAANVDPSLLCAIGYTRSKKYKLVEFYGSHQRLEGGIMTLGVDKEWRCIYQSNGTLKFDNFIYEFNCCKPIATADGILHWGHHRLPLVLNLDLETETFYTCATPKSCSVIEKRTYLGTWWSYFFMDYLEKFSWELWLLKDARTSEWTKMAIIDLGPHEQMLRQTLCPTGFRVVPVGLLKDGEIAVLHVTYEDGVPEEKYYHHPKHPVRNCVTYNVKTGMINSFYLDKGRARFMDKSWRYTPHVKSLVSPKFSAN